MLRRSPGRPQLTRVPSVPSVLFANVNDVHDAFVAVQLLRPLLLGAIFQELQLLLACYLCDMKISYLLTFYLTEHNLQ